MIGKRTYDDGCPAAHALDLVGERWALLVVRELLFGPKRFSDLRAGLPGISPNVLTQRLAELERARVLMRHTLPPPAATRVYALTPRGRELATVLGALGRWGAGSPLRPRKAPLGIDALMLSLQTTFDARAAAGAAVRLVFDFGTDRFRVTVARGALVIARDATALNPPVTPALAARASRAPEAVAVTDPATLSGIIFGGAGLSAAVRARRLQVTGDRAALERFVQWFTLPAAAAA